MIDDNKINEDCKSDIKIVMKECLAIREDLNNMEDLTDGDIQNIRDTLLIMHKMLKKNLNNR